MPFPKGTAKHHGEQENFVGGGEKKIFQATLVA